MVRRSQLMVKIINMTLESKIRVKYVKYISFRSLCEFLFHLWKVLCCVVVVLHNQCLRCVDYKVGFKIPIWPCIQM